MKDELRPLTWLSGSRFMLSWLYGAAIQRQENKEADTREDRLKRRLPRMEHTIETAHLWPT